MTTTDFGGLLKLLTDAEVGFVLIGGLAGTAHGSARATLDVDVVYDRAEQNLERLAAALAGHEPSLREAPPGLPFRWDSRTLKSGLNFTLRTDLGDLDVLGEVAGGGTFETLADQSEWITIFGVRCRCVSLSRLIELKRAAGRPKDLEAIAELEAIREELEQVG